MADRMTPEQAAELRLPEGCSLRIDKGEWFRYFDWSPRIDRWHLTHLAEGVANGHLPPAILDWAWAAYEGRPVPTPEQWEAAVRFVSSVHCAPGDERARLRDIISPPKPKLAPPPSPRPVVDLFHGSRLGRKAHGTEPAWRLCYNCKFSSAHVTDTPCFGCYESTGRTHWEPKP